ncbi:MAG: hypothetical protein IJE07_14665 [Clostridia bacterium]|nr:hypothetical protein [Clostridia bacterium]
MLAIAAGLFCALYGMRAAGSLQQEARDLRRWADLLAHLTLIIRQAALPLPKALQAAADLPLAPDRFLRAAADHMLRNPLSTPAESFSAVCPACTGRETLLRLFTRLERGDADSMSLACQQAAEEIAQQAASAQQRASGDAKLWRTLGWTCGATLTLLLL